MPSEIASFRVTTPAGTSIANPLVTKLTMLPRKVVRIEVVIPRGCNGVLGFAIGGSGAVVLPSNPGEWIVTSGEKLDWAIENQIDSGAWEIRTYNVGNYAHTLSIRFHLDYVALAPPAPVIDTTGLLNLSSAGAGDQLAGAAFDPLAGFGV